jgi:cysteinyl-tRNA synthetase
MSYELLGESFDIHGGGNDLIFPHHENEIAQSCCAHPEGGFAQVWMHNEMLQVEGKKMSKSLGNFFTVRDLLDQGVPGEVIRFVFLSTHYRKPMDWTAEKAREAERIIKSWVFALVKAQYSADLVHLFKKQGVWKPAPSVVEALAEDLNTPSVITALHRMDKDGRARELIGFAASLEWLGLVPEDRWDELHVLSGLGVGSAGESPHHDFIAAMMLKRDEAKSVRDYRTADAIREALVAAGVIVNDRKGSPSSFTLGPDFDPAKLEALK